MNVHIVMPCYNHWDLTHARLYELYNIERANIKSITVINDASDDEDVTEQGLEWWMKAEMDGKPEIRAMHAQTNLGFLRACNIALGWVLDEYASADDVVILLSNDVKIQTKFIEQICDILGSVKAVVGGKLLSQDTGWNKFGEKLYPYLEGWLLAALGETWAELHGFDELFAPQDYEDIDFSTRAVLAGYELIPLNNPGITHIGAQTYGYNPAREENTLKNKKKFQEKWTK